MAILTATRIAADRLGQAVSGDYDLLFEATNDLVELLVEARELLRDEDFTKQAKPLISTLFQAMRHLEGLARIR